jgi:hypothetical protein
MAGNKGLCWMMRHSGRKHGIWMSLNSTEIYKEMQVPFVMWIDMQTQFQILATLPRILTRSNDKVRPSSPHVATARLFEACLVPSLSMTQDELFREEVINPMPLPQLLSNPFFHPLKKSYLQSAIEPSFNLTLYTFYHLCINMAPTSNITLYFLQASRSIRIAWLLEELGLSYESIFFPRENNKVPADFKEKSGNSLAKAPALKDGSLVITESGAITE